jgi:hypothetical protein
MIDARQRAQKAISHKLGWQAVAAAPADRVQQMLAEITCRNYLPKFAAK